MSSESGQRLPMEELKRRNAPQPIPTQTCPSKEEWQELLHRLDELERHTAAHTALLREVSSRRELYPTREQMEALTRDMAEVQRLLKQAGKKKEISISPPNLRTAMSVVVWLALILLGTMVAMVVLQVIWSGLAALWSAVKILIP
mgnify:CR=1 FL=1